MYALFSSQLWVKLQERYGKANGHLIYQLKREIISMSQGSMNVAEYYTKLKMLWDELLCVVPMPKADHE